MEQSYEAVVAGQACLDLTPRFKDPTKPIQEIFRPGGGMRLTSVAFSGGGAVCNTGLALHRLGVKTLLWGRVGDDLFGRELVSILEKEKADACLTTCPGEDTPMTLVIVQPGEDRLFLHLPGADDGWTADDVDYNVLKNARLFHFGYPTAMARMYENGGAELTQLFMRAKRTGVLTSLDTSMPHHGAEKEDWTSILSRTLPFVDFFCPSIEEALAFVDPADYAAVKEEARRTGGCAADRIGADEAEALADCFVAMGAGATLIKCAARGLYLHTGNIGIRGWKNTRRWQPAMKAGEVVSSSGAGDTAIAGFLGAVLKDCGPDEALRCAAMAGALAVTGVTSHDRLPDSVEALADLAAKSETL